MKEGYVTIPEISKQTGIPESTARRYLEQHNHALRTKKSGRGAWLLNEEDLPLMKMIRNCYEQKMSVNEVTNYLLESGQPLTITVEDEQEQTVTPAQAYMRLVQEVHSLKSEVETTKEQLAVAHEEIREFKAQQKQVSDEQTEVISTLTNEMKSVSEGISRLERERQKKREKGFWGLFSRK